MTDVKRFVLSFVMVLSFSANWLLSKYALDEFPPILLVAFRFGVTAVALVWFVKPPWRQIPEIAVISTVVAVVPYSMIYCGLQSLDVSVAVVLGQLDAPIVIMLGAIFLKEYPSYRKVVGIIVAFSGTFVIMGSPSLSGQYFEALMIVFSFVIWGIGQIGIRRMDGVSTFAQVVWIAVLATPQLLLVSAIFEEDQIQIIQHVHWAVWSSILCLGLITAPIGVGLWYSLVREYTFAGVAPFLLIVPAISVAGGVVFFGENLTLHFVTGALIVLLGIGSILIEPQPKPLTERRKVSVS